MELRSISLESIGVDGIAYTKSEALRIAEEYYNSNIPILGGDVYFFNNGNIKPTYDCGVLKNIDGSEGLRL